MSSPLFTRPDKNRPPNTKVVIKNKITAANHNLLSALLRYIQKETAVKAIETTANKPFIPFTSDYRKKGRKLTIRSRELMLRRRALPRPVNLRVSFSNACLECPYSNSISHGNASIYQFRIVSYETILIQVRLNQPRCNKPRNSLQIRKKMWRVPHIFVEHLMDVHRLIETDLEYQVATAR